MNTVKALGKVIIELRKKHSFSQRQVANASNLSLNHLIKIENGKQRSVTLPVLSRIASVFGLKAHEVTTMMEKVMKWKKD